MIMGINTDVSFKGEVLHVQTEDLGGSEPAIESLVFLRGQTLETIRKSYDSTLQRTPELLQERLKAQHRTVIQAVLKDRFAEAMSRLGGAPERPRLVTSELDEPRAGASASFLVLLQAEPSRRPLAGATVHALLQSADDLREIYRGQTDARGFHLAELQLPSDLAQPSALILRAQCRLGEAEASFPILAKGAESTATERPSLMISELEEPRAGETASLLILLRAEPTCRPVAGAQIRVELVEEDRPRELHRGTTDRRGFHMAEFPVPADPPAGSKLLVQAIAPCGTAEALFPVLR